MENKTKADELDDTKKSVRGVLATQSTGVPVHEFDSSYRDLIGTVLPYNRFNCKNPEEFIMKHMTDVATLGINPSGQKVFMAVVTEEMEHVISLINRTKPAVKARPKKVSFSYHTKPRVKHPRPTSSAANKKQFGTGSRFNQYSEPTRHWGFQDRTSRCSKIPEQVSSQKNLLYPRRFSDENKKLSGDCGSSSNAHTQNGQFTLHGQSSLQGMFPRGPSVFQRLGIKSSTGLVQSELKRIFGDAAVKPSSAEIDEKYLKRKFEELKILKRKQLTSSAKKLASDSREFQGNKLQLPKKSIVPCSPFFVQFANRGGPNSDVSIYNRSLSLDESRDSFEFSKTPGKFQDCKVTVPRKSLESLSPFSIQIANSGNSSNDVSVSLFEHSESSDRSQNTPEKHEGFSASKTSGVPNKIFKDLIVPQATSSITVSGAVFPTNMLLQSGLVKFPLRSSAAFVTNTTQTVVQSILALPLLSVTSPALASLTSRNIHSTQRVYSVASATTPPSLGPKQHPFSSDDLSIFPPVTTSGFSSSKFNCRVNVNNNATQLFDTNPQKPTEGPSSFKLVEVTNSAAPVSSSPQDVRYVSPHDAITPTSSASDQALSLMLNIGQEETVVIDEVFSVSKILGHFVSSGEPVCFLLTNLEEIDVDLDYVKILLLGRTFKAVFDFSMSKYYGTLYKTNEADKINMNLFILEETLDPPTVKKGNQKRLTYTVSELFSIRRKVSQMKTFAIVDTIQQRELVRTPAITIPKSPEVKMAVIHAVDDFAKMWLDFVSLDEIDQELPKPTRQIVNGKTRVTCFLKNFSYNEIEWTTADIAKLKDSLKSGMKVLVKIFERSYCGDENIFSIDLRSIQQCFYFSDALKINSVLCLSRRVPHVGRLSYGERIFVTYIRSPQYFYALPVKHFRELMDMFAAMQEFYKDKQNKGSAANAVQEGYLYSVKSHEDNFWYRGRAERLLEDSKILVNYVDIGNYETIVDKQNIGELPNSFRSCPLLSCFMKLAGEMPHAATKNDLEKKILHKVYRYFPLNPGNQHSPVILLSPYDNNTPLIHY